MKRAVSTIAACTVLAAVAALASGGCGYTTGLKMRAEDGQSIGVEFFGNETLERDIERDFQGEMTRALRDLSDVPVAGVEHADTIVRGTIREYHRRSGIRSPENVLLETGIFLEVEASLYRRGGDKPLRGPYRPSTWIGFVIEPTGEHEREARNRAIRHVAEELVLDLFSPVH